MGDCVKAISWVIWLLCLAMIAMLIRNPLYAIIILLVVELVRRLWAQPGQGFRLSLWRFGAIVLFFSGMFNMFFVHVGATELFRLPANIPLIGGAITLEGLVAGMSNGLTLVSLLAVFLAFNQIVSTSELARMTPAAFRDVGVVLLIALTFVPQTQQHMQQVREAQAVRGHQLRGLRDWRPLILPLLVGGLERAFNLAEAMVSRGYGQTGDADAQPLVRVGILVGLVFILLGWLMALFIGAIGWALFGCGAVLVGALIWWMGSFVEQTVYRPKPTTRSDAATIIASLLPLIPIWLFRNELSWQPFPALHLPPFNPWIGLLLLSFALPAVFNFQFSIRSIFNLKDELKIEN